MKDETSELKSRRPISMSTVSFSRYTKGQVHVTNAENCVINFCMYIRYMQYADCSGHSNFRVAQFSPTSRSYPCSRIEFGTKQGDEELQ